MKTRCLIQLVLTVTLSGCATISFDATDGLIRPKANVRRQCEYIEKTRKDLAQQVHLATPDFSDSILSSRVTTNGTREYVYLVTDKYVPVGADGWLLFSAHSLHKEPNWRYVNIGDLSIAIDHAGQYYFSRKHVCGFLEVHSSQSGIYDSSEDFLRRNPDWCRMPDNWEQTAPSYPAIDITAHVLGTWRATSLTSSCHAAYANLQFEDDFKLLCKVKTHPREDRPATLYYSIMSSDKILFTQDNGFGKAGELHLIGSKLVGHLVTINGVFDTSYRTESTVTNRLEGIWERVNDGEAPAR
jgi:hypothetical protein